MVLLVIGKEADSDLIKGDLAKLTARLEALNAVYKGSDLTEVAKHYTDHAEEIGLPHDYPIAVKMAQRLGQPIPVKEDVQREEALRRFRLDVGVAKNFLAKGTEDNPLAPLGQLIDEEKGRLDKLKHKPQPKLTTRYLSKVVAQNLTFNAVYGNLDLESVKSYYLNNAEEICRDLTIPLVMRSGKEEVLRMMALKQFDSDLQQALESKILDPLALDNGFYDQISEMQGEELKLKIQLRIEQTSRPETSKQLEEAA